MAQHRIVIDINVIDMAAFHTAAVKSFGSDDWQETLGSSSEPNVAACLTEILCERCPADMGFELLHYVGWPA